MTNSTLAVSTAQEKKNKVLDVALCAGCKNRITKNPPFFCSDCQWRAMIDRMERDAESHVGSLPVEVQIDMEEEDSIDSHIGHLPECGEICIC